MKYSDFFYKKSSRIVLGTAYFGGNNRSVTVNAKTDLSAYTGKIYIEYTIK